MPEIRIFPQSCRDRYRGILSYGTAEKPETFQLRLTAFPNGFIILVADNEIAAYGCSEKWLTEREPGLDEDPLTTHQPAGRILCITALAVKMKYRGRGYGLRCSTSSLRSPTGKAAGKSFWERLMLKIV
jgi:hypothetical protein